MLSILSMLSTALAERLLADAVKHKRIPTHSSLQWRQGYSASPGLRSRSNPFPAAASTALMAAVNGLHDASLTREAVAEALCSASLALLDQNAEEPWDLTRVAVGAAFDSGGSSKQRSSHGAGFMPAGGNQRVPEAYYEHCISCCSPAASVVPPESEVIRAPRGAIAKHQGTGPLHDASLGNVAYNHRGIDIETCEDSSKGCSSPRQASVSCSGDRDTEQGAEPLIRPRCQKQCFTRHDHAREQHQGSIIRRSCSRQTAAATKVPSSQAAACCVLMAMLLPKRLFVWIALTLRSSSASWRTSRGSVGTASRLHPRRR